VGKGIVVGLVAVASLLVGVVAWCCFRRLEVAVFVGFGQVAGGGCVKHW